MKEFGFAQVWGPKYNQKAGLVLCFMGNITYIF